jgi:transposase
MDTAVEKPGKRRWSAEKKLEIMEQWRNGLPVEELSRRYGVASSQLYKWKRDLEQGLKDRGEMVPKSQVIALQKKVDELEKALGRKSLEVDVLKKFFELKGLKPPDGQ